MGLVLWVRMSGKLAMRLESGIGKEGLERRIWSKGIIVG
jgi:hypothetical protein